MNLPPMRMGAFANPAMAPTGASAAASPQGASPYLESMRSQQVVSGMQALAPTAQTQAPMQSVDAARQMAMAAQTAQLGQGQMQFSNASEMLMKHALRAAPETGQLQQLAAMVRAARSA